MKKASIVQIAAIVCGVLDSLLVPSLWLGAGRSCPSELQFIVNSVLLYTFKTSFFDAAMLSLRNKLLSMFVAVGTVVFAAIKVEFYIPNFHFVCGQGTVRFVGYVLPAQNDEPKLPARKGLLRVLSLARAQWVCLLVGSLGMVANAATTVAVPVFFGNVVEVIVGSKSNDELVKQVLILAGVLTLGSVASFLRAWMFELAGQRLVAQLRKDLFRSIAKQDIAFFDGTRTGELTNRLASDTAVLQSAATVDISMTLRYIVQIIASMAMLFTLSWSLTLVMLAVVPIVAVGAVAYGRFLKRMKRAFQDALAESNAFASECISNIRTVRSFAQEKKTWQTFDKFINKALGIGSKQALSLGLFNGGLGFVAQAALALVLWYGGSQVLRGVLTPGLLISFLFQTLSVAMAFAFLSSVYGDFMSAVGASERVFELIDREPDIPSEGGRKLHDVKGEVRFKNVKFAYPARSDQEVLHGIDFTLEPGRVHAVVGQSGGGKSTLVALIERFYDPLGGTVSLDGVDIRELDPRSYRKHIGLVSQEPVLFAATIAENIAYGVAEATQEQIVAAARQANAHMFISTFSQGYETMVGERGVRLSGGQKQRIAIARALLLNPKILLLDEATSALDSESEHLVQEAIDRLMVGRTVLVIAHRLSTVRNAHVVAVVQDGKIVQRGTHDELMAVKGTYRKLVKRQLKST